MSLDAASYPLLWQLSDATGARPEFVIPVLAYESGLNPGALNGDGYAGINQINPGWLQSAGIDQSDYLTWPASRQLSTVALPYFESIANKYGPLDSGIRVYQAEYLPATLSTAGLDTPIASSPSQAYVKNISFDPSRKGYITPRDLGVIVAKMFKQTYVQRAIDDAYALRPGEMMQNPVFGRGMSPLATVVVAASAVFLIDLGVSYFRPDLLPRWARLPV